MPKKEPVKILDCYDIDIITEKMVNFHYEKNCDYEDVHFVIYDDGTTEFVVGNAE